MPDYFDSINAYEANALNIQTETAAYEKSLNMLMRDQDLQANRQVVAMHEEADEIDVDINACYQEFSNDRFFMTMHYNASVIALKRTMWSEFGRIYAKFETTLSDLEERAGETQNAVVNCHVDDDDCFVKGWDQLDEIRGLIETAEIEMHAHQIKFDLMKESFFGQWRDKLNIYLDITYRNEDSDLNAFKECVQQKIMEYPPIRVEL